jgi:hypothetical protein
MWIGRDPSANGERRQHPSSAREVSMAVAPWIVPDELWERIEPMLPKVERRFRDTGLRGGICRSNSASAPARPATAA